jgi:hypothetical protein
MPQERPNHYGHLLPGRGLVPDAPDEPVKTVHFPKTPLDAAIDNDDAIWAKRARPERAIGFWSVIVVAILLVMVFA